MLRARRPSCCVRVASTPSGGVLKRRLLALGNRLNAMILLPCVAAGCSLVLELEAPAIVVGGDYESLGDARPLPDADFDGGYRPTDLGEDRDRGPGTDADPNRPDGASFDRGVQRLDQGPDLAQLDFGVDAIAPDAAVLNPEDLWVWVPLGATVWPLQPDNMLGAALDVAPDGRASLGAPLPPGVVVYERIAGNEGRATLILGIEARDRIDLRRPEPPQPAQYLGRTRVSYANPEPITGRHDVTIGCFGTLVPPPGTVEFDVYSDCVSPVRGQPTPTFSALAIAYDDNDVPQAFSLATDLVPSALTEVELPEWRADFRRFDFVFEPSDVDTRVGAHAALMRHALKFGILGARSENLNPFTTTTLRQPLAEAFGEEAIEAWFEAERTFNGVPTVRRFFSRLAAFPEVLRFNVESDLPPAINRIEAFDDTNPQLLSWRERDRGWPVNGIWAQAVWSDPAGVFEWRVLAEPGTRRINLPVLPPDVFGPQGTRSTLQVTLLNCDAAEDFADVRNGVCPLAHRSMPMGWRGTLRTSTATGP